MYQVDLVLIVEQLSVQWRWWAGGQSQQGRVPEKRHNFRSTRTRGVVFGEEIMVVNVGKGREENAGTTHLRSNEISLILEWSHDGSTN